MATPPDQPLVYEPDYRWFPDAFGSSIVGAVASTHFVSIMFTDVAAGSFMLFRFSPAGPLAVVDTVAHTLSQYPSDYTHPDMQWAEQPYPAGDGSKVLYLYTEDDTSTPCVTRISMDTADVLTTDTVTAPSTAFRVFCDTDGLSLIQGSDGTLYHDVHGSGWSCSVAGTHPHSTGICVGSPSTNRWIRVSGALYYDGADWDFDTVDLTVDLVNSSGTTLDSLTFTPPNGSWVHDLSNTPATYSSVEAYCALWWMVLPGNRIMYVGRRTSGGGFPSGTGDVVCRVLDCTGDTLAWESAEYVVPLTDPLGYQQHPRTSTWDGTHAVLMIAEDLFA